MVATLLRALVFPLGRTYSAPSDQLGHEVATLLMTPAAARDRLCAGIFVPTDQDDAVGQLAAAHTAVVAAAPAYRKLRDALRDGNLPQLDPAARLEAARNSGILSDTEYRALQIAEELSAGVIAVDDFAPDALGRSEAKPAKKATRERNSA
jgi:acyl-CoA dehydrogenase